MAEISSQMVKELRERTGAGMLDCKNALVEAKGAMESAIEIIRKKGLAKVNKRAGKTAAEGTIGVYKHAGEQVVSIVELNCETDFVARGDEFKALAFDVAMQVAAMNPQYVTTEEVPAAVLEKEKEILRAQLSPEQQAKADKILPGKLEKFYEDRVLLKQLFVKDESGKKTVGDIINEYSAKCGEKVVVRRMQRFEVGEGIAKESTDFAAEVASMVQPTH